MVYFVEIFNERKNEIEEFINTMILIEQKNDKKRSIEGKTEFQDFFSNDKGEVPIAYQTMINILKSNVILMLYNIIEFTITGLIDAIYSAIKGEELTYVDVNKKIQQIWTRSMIKVMKDPNSNQNTFFKKSKEMIDHIIEKRVLNLYAKQLLSTGNLDGVQIIKTLEEHGIRYDTTNENYRPDKLEYVKTKRNELAHGSISFTEALRNVTINDISEDKTIIFSFLENLIEVLKKYTNDREYRNAKKA